MPIENSTSQTPMKRVSRACLLCRQRKSKCDLDISGGAPPCGRCLKDNRECVLGSSNRGGARIRKKKRSVSGGETLSRTTGSLPGSEQGPLPNLDLHRAAGSERSATDKVPRPTEGPTTFGGQEDAVPSSPESPTGTTLPTNPSDAWQLLRDVAVGNASGDQGASHDQSLRRGSDVGLSAKHGSTIRGIWSYRLVREGHLTREIVAGLIKDFKEHYHAYLPLVPSQYYEPDALDQFAVESKHLLTAILTIASKDIPGEHNYVHECCSRYMHDLIASIAAGTDCDVEAVEALLLLAEWVPHGLRKSGQAVGRGEEDRTAWMHVGMALRTGYFLGLDRTSFRSENKEEDRAISRKRLAWTCCYISDRLISCRIGKAFWSRGPGPMTGLSSQDFPSLQPANPGDENHARIFKAVLDLTQIYSTVHDILYTATRANGQMVLMGDYVKYIDEFRSTISRWHQQYGALICSPHIKVTLDLSYHYLQLYTNAFAFQAAISQALARRERGDGHPGRDYLRKLFKDIGGMPDARFIFRSIESAKQYLSIFTTYVDAQTLRYMPIRFYLYCIYSAVFLYKARSFGALRSSEEPQISEMITATVTKLKQASVNPQDSGARYARLLELLWQKSKPMPATEGTINHISPTANMLTPPSVRPSETGSAGVHSNNSPTDGFSWLDLGATADYASADQFGKSLPGMMGSGAVNDDISMGLNFLPRPPTHGVDLSSQQQYPWQTNLDFAGGLPF